MRWSTPPSTSPRLTRQSQRTKPPQTSSEHQSPRLRTSGLMRLILDIHVPAAVARGLEAGGIDVVHAAIWQGGAIRTAPDADILTLAATEGRVLVSYDTKTLRPL